MNSLLNSKPAYVLLANQLKKRLSDQKGNQLPTFRDIAKEYNVTLGVVQRAMKQLERESLVQVQRSTGSKRICEEIEPELLCYGLIHPYSANGESDLAFSMNLLHAFEKLNSNAVPLIRASANDPERERENAEKLAANNLIDGLLVSPCVDTNNGELLSEIARKKPVVIVENPIDDIDLPTVTFDYAAAGQEIGREFRKKGCRKTVVLLNTDTDNRSLNQLQEALRNEIEIEICRLPLFQIEQQCKNWDYELFEKSCVELEQILAKRECDSVFSPFDTHFDKILISGVRERFRRDLTSAVICSDIPGWYTEEFARSGVMMWQFSSLELFTLAASRLLNWKRSHQPPRGLRSVKLKRIR